MDAPGNSSNSFNLTFDSNWYNRTFREYLIADTTTIPVINSSHNSGAAVDIQPGRGLLEQIRENAVQTEYSRLTYDLLQRVISEALFPDPIDEVKQERKSRRERERER